ncbi:zinc metalloproteinase-disintegrin-like crotastatin [Hyla sarda]|uniref:zinc metalloproteinase-disintegrin-like crotastatin n=1 Tax=Hyla sarda TaxID=327740 RepID=UPI0024C35C41|nr:zinc metalloproteinase-disintegrin-like crotastatin [Hyla sarda]
MTTSEDQIQDHCHYQGYVMDDEESLVSVSTCSGVSGVIVTHGHKFLIEPLNPSDNGEHVMYEAEMDIPKTCGVMSTEDTYKNISLSMQTDQETHDNILTSQKYIELYIVADKSMFETYGRNLSLVKKKIFEIVNYVNKVYKLVSIFVALTGIEIWETKDQIEMSSVVGENLARFAMWRQQNLLPRVTHDNAVLITHIDFVGTVVGLGYIGTMCSSAYSAAVIQDFSTFSAIVGATLAHEMGHNLGMDHDEIGCSCPYGVCIMATALSSKIPDHFSECSLKQLGTFLLNHHPECMMNKPNKKTIVAPAVCGNGFTELGEDCDCGTEQECTNPCCNAATCKLRAYAMCAEGACCERCQIKTTGTVCRPSSSEDCDLPATCDGTSNVCPRNRQKGNGVPCKDGQGYCYNGRCPTRRDQCTHFWGPGAVVSEDLCYTFNTKGTFYGHCTQYNKTYVACDKADVKCGVLFCFGGTSIPTVLSSTFSFLVCKAVMAPIGMVENGTQCGDRMVCFNGKCLATDTVYTTH